MKFSIQEEGKEKKVFLTFKDANEATGIPSSHIWKILKRDNSKYTRRSDKKVFFIQEERDEKLCMIDGEGITSFQQIQEKFGLTPTKFLNQIARKKKHFIDKDEISHKVEWLSLEIIRIFDLKIHQDMEMAIKRNAKHKKSMMLEVGEFKIGME